MTDADTPLAFLDASVLYPALLRNILMRLALHDLFRAYWSARVHDEWITALLRNRPDLDRERLANTRRLMDTHIQDALVEGFEHRIDALTLPDSDDRHVLAAAIHCGAGVIVTTNLRDFPTPLLEPHGVTAVHPDAFIVGLLVQGHGAALAAMRQLRSSFHNPPKTAADLLMTMNKQGLTASAHALAPFADDL